VGEASKEATASPAEAYHGGRGTNPGSASTCDYFGPRVSPGGCAVLKSDLEGGYLNYTTERQTSTCP
jgi:hypothetical protein